MNERYSLCLPVKGGMHFWVIEDTERERQLVTISADFPHAEREAKRLYELLTGEKS